MKKQFLAFGLIALLVLSLSACGEKPGAGRAGTAPNEVLTLKEVSEDKSLITLRVQDGMNSKLMESAIEARFPEVDIVTVANTPTKLDYENNNLEDLFCITMSNADRANYASQLIDLSGQPFTQNYHLNALNDCSQDGRLPFLPGPASIYGIVYDKDLFEANGWKVPADLDGFVNLCKEIDTSGIRAIQPSLYYTDATRQMFAGFTYDQLFAGIDNYQWLLDYRAGEASMKGHIEPGFETMKRLMEAGILRSGDFEVLPKVRSKMMYEEHTCAMILETQLAPVYAAQIGKGQEHSLGMMPFYSGGPDSDYLFSVPTYYIGANARLEEKGNEKKLEQVLAILDWMSSVEGQQALIDPSSPMISSVKGVPLFDNEFLAGVEKTIEKGHVVPQPFLVGNAGSATDGALKEGLMAWSKGESTIEEVIVKCDETRDKDVKNQLEKDVTVIGTAKTDFTVLETSLYLAELFKNEMEADIGLCLANSRSCGNNIRFYAGEIEVGAQNYVDNYLSRGFTNDSIKENGDKQLQRVEMTGQQLLDTLNNPPEQEFYPDCYYAAAGLDIEFAPWAGDGKRYVRVSLADGSSLDPAATYTVALWNGSVNEQYLGKVQAVSEHTVSEMFIADVKEKGEIAPLDDGRFSLNWKLTESGEK